MLCTTWPWLSKAISRAFFQHQFWVPRASVRHTKTVTCPGSFWVLWPWPYESAPCPSNMTFLYNNQKRAFIWKQIASFILVFVQWGSEKGFTSACGRQQGMHAGQASLGLHLMWTYDMTNTASVFGVWLPCATAHPHCFEESQQCSSRNDAQHIPTSLSPNHSKRRQSGGRDVSTSEDQWLV